MGIGMKAETKTIDGKSVTVTQRRYAMPDGSIRTKVDREVVGAKKTKTSPRVKKVSSSSSSKPATKTTTTEKIVDGMKHTITTFPGGSTETKIESINKVGDKIRNDKETKKKKKRVSSKTQKKKKNAVEDDDDDDIIMKKSGVDKPIRTRTKIVNGRKETTFTYADGRTETKVEEEEGPSSSSSSGRQRKKKRPILTRTNIVNGRKETTIEYDDGTTETKIIEESTATTNINNNNSNNNMEKNRGSTPQQQQQQQFFDDWNIPKTTRPSRGKENYNNDNDDVNNDNNNDNDQQGRIVSSDTRTKIVNGKKHVTTTRTVRMPDGSTRTKTETKIERK